MVVGFSEGTFVLEVSEFLGAAGPLVLVTSSETTF